MASRARSPGRLAAPAAGGRLPGLGLVTHRRHFNAASQRSHTGEPPTRHIFSSRRAAVRAHSTSKNGVRRRPPRPPHAPSGSVPLGQTGGVRDKRQFNTEKPNSPQMRVLPPAPANQSRRRGPRMAKANARLLVSPSHGPRFPARSPSPAPRLSPRPSSSSPLLVFVLVFVLFVDLVEPGGSWPVPAVTLGPTC